VVVLMCHVNLDKYKACGTVEQRNLVLRDDLATSAGGDFQAVADFLMALKSEDEHFQLEMLQQTRHRRRRRLQHPHSEGRRGRKSNSGGSSSSGGDDSGSSGGEDPGVTSTVNSGRFQFDFSLAPGFQQALMLEDEVADGAGGEGLTQGSAFLNALLLQTACTRKDAMLQLLQQFVEEKGCVPRRWEVYRGVKLGHWCQHLRTRYRLQAISRQEMAAVESAVPQWQWPERTGILAHKNAEEMVGLLKEYVEEFRELPKGGVVYKGVKLGGWCGYQQTKQRRGTLRGSVKVLLESVPQWTWVVRMAEGILL
jgi:hypothetical protein